MQLRKETCIGCECELQYTKSIPTKQMGVMMHMGERFCTGGKRARKFKRSDPKIYVPDWCPKRKKPCELRVYCFKNKNEWRLHEMLCHDLGMDISPDGWRYAPLYELHTDLTPREFAKICNDAPDAETLHVAVHRHYVVEIDDGLRLPSSIKRSAAMNWLRRLMQRRQEKINGRTPIEQYGKKL